MTVKVCGQGGGIFDIATETKGPALAEIAVETYTDWEEISCELPDQHGATPIYLRYHGMGSAEFLEIALMQEAK